MFTVERIVVDLSGFPPALYFVKPSFFSRLKAFFFDFTPSFIKWFIAFFTKDRAIRSISLDGDCRGAAKITLKPNINIRHNKFRSRRYVPLNRDGVESV